MALSNNQPPIDKLRDHPELVAPAAAWFHSKWGIAEDAYLASMTACLAGRSTVSRWYIMRNVPEIIAGLGVIDNDFHNRKDLTPNVCAVYVDPAFRGKGLAGRLLDFVCDYMKSAGIDTLYLLTDHQNFYERYGWVLYDLVQGDGEAGLSRMYVRRS